MASFNVRSVNNKSASISDLISEYHLDVLALQETWHENTDSLSLRRAVPPGYCVVDAARNINNNDNIDARMHSTAGGGVAIIYREVYKCHKVGTLPSVNAFEYVCCRLTTTARYDLIILSIYRPGSRAVTNEFFNDFTVLLEALATFRCPIFILGDINIHLERSNDTHTVELVELLESFDMKQFVVENTHKYGGRLDVIIARSDEVVNEIKVIETGISDHSMLVCQHKIPINNTSDFVPLEGRKWNNFILDDFRNDLRASRLFTCDEVWMRDASVDDLFEIYNHDLTALIDKHAPRYIRKRKPRLLSPWYDNECRMFKRNVRRLERKYRKSKNSSDRKDWILKLKEQAVFFRQKERDYWLIRINQNADSPKGLWRDLETLLRRNDETPVLPRPEATKKAEEFINFFDQKVSMIRDATATTKQPSYLPQCSDESLSVFAAITPDQIVKLVSSCSNKCCGLDPIPTNLLKNCIDLLAPFISKVFARSLSEGHVPLSQKVAIIRPHLKKRGLDATDCKNFRPVSNLSFLSKLLEKIVANQVNDFLQRCKAYPLLQSAYRKFHSTETALLKVFSDLCKAVDEGNICLLGLLDLSAAFDTVDHHILLTRLNSSFGISGTVLDWFRSYLNDRRQFVSMSGCKSSFSNVRCGIPQGSILGPLLFILYTSPLTDIINAHGLWSHCYADDTQIYFYCSPDQVINLTNSFSRCIADLEGWMTVNRLKLNCDKTEFLWISSQSRLESINISNISITVGNDVIAPFSGARSLGVFFDRHLNLHQHIINVCRLCFYQLRQLRVVCKSLPRSALKTLLHAFVSSRLDYCNSLLFGLPKYEIRKLQSIQNTAARLLGGLKRYDHVTPILRDELHWLPITARIEFKIALLTYKALHNQAPEYLSSMCHLASDSTGLSRNRSATNGDLIPFSWNTTHYGKRSFYYSSPQIWNNLPKYIKEQSTTTNFVKNLKTFLFSKEYDVH